MKKSTVNIDILDLLDELKGLKSGKTYSYDNIPKNLTENLANYAIRNKTSNISEEILFELVEFFTPLILSSFKSSGTSLSFEIIDDIKSEVKIFIYENILKFDIKKNNNLGAFLKKTSNMGFVREVRTELLSSGQLDRNWIKIKSAYYFESEKFYLENKRYPSLQEAEILVRDNLVKRRIEFVSKNSKKKSISALKKEADTFLKKQGLDKALSELPAIISLGGSDLRLDQKVNDESDSTFAHLIIDTKNSSSETLIDTLYMIALGDHQVLRPALADMHGLLGEVEGSSDDVVFDNDFSFTKYSKVFDMPKPIIKGVLSKAKSRVLAPHAQFSYLSANVNLSSESDYGYTGNDFI